MKRYSSLLRSSKLESHHQTQFSVIPRTLLSFNEYSELFREYSQLSLRVFFILLDHDDELPDIIQQEKFLIGYDDHR